MRFKGWLSCQPTLPKRLEPVIEVLVPLQALLMGQDVVWSLTPVVLSCPAQLRLLYDSMPWRYTIPFLSRNINIFVFVVYVIFVTSLLRFVITFYIPWDIK